MITLRASSSPLAMLCPGSLRTDTDAVRMNVGSAAADLGTAAHRACEALVTEGSVRWSQLNEVALRYECDAEELRMLCGMATNLWAQSRDSFPNALTEQQLSHASERLLVTGTADIVSIGGSVGRIADWKFGFRDSNPHAQLKTYAALLLLAYPELTQATATVLWVHEQEIENYTMGRAGAAEWFAQIERTIVDWNGVYRVGVHCEHCPRRHCCPAGKELARRDVRAFIDDSPEDRLAQMQPDDIIATLELARRVGRYAEACAEAIKAHVTSNGDVVGSERVATIVRESRRALAPLAAFPVLQDSGFTDEDMAAIMTLSLGRAEGIVAARAPKRERAAAKRQLAAQLDAAGAIEAKYVEKLIIRRI